MDIMGLVVWVLETLVAFFVTCHILGIANMVEPGSQSGRNKSR